MESKLSDLLEALKAKGFNIGVDTYSDISELFRVLPHSISNDDLKTSLSSIIVNSQKQQELFYQTFDEVYNSNEKKNEPETISGLSRETNNESINHNAQNHLSNIWITRAAIAGFCVLVIVGVWQLLYSPDSKEEVGNGLAQLDQKGSAIDTLNNINNLLEQDSLNIDTTSTRPSKIKPKLDYSPLSIPDISRLHVQLTWLEKNELSIKYAFSGLILIAVFLIYITFRRRTSISNTTGIKPPWLWSIEIKDQLTIELSETFNWSTIQMNKRVASGQSFLEPRQSVEASVARGGAVKLIYEEGLLPTSYLLLIDQRSKANQQSRLFEFLHQSMNESEVETVRFFFNSTPEVCWNEKNPMGLRIQEMRLLYPNHRLMILGAGERLVNFTTGKLGDWTSVFLKWEHKVLMTPKPLKEWGWNELLISKVLFILPATVQGIASAIDHFNLEKQEQPSLKNFERQQYISLEGDEAQVIEKLKTLLGHKEDTFSAYTWLCACCLYPELSWDVTLYLGNELSNEKLKLLTEKNIFLLTQLSWFQEGRIPDSFVARLLKDLPPTERENAENALFRLLEDSLPNDIQSQSYQERKLYISVNKLSLTTNASERKKLSDEIKVLSKQIEESEFISVDYVSYSGKRTKGLILPRSFSHRLMETSEYSSIRRKLTKYAAILLVAVIIIWQFLFPYNVFNNKQSAKNNGTQYSLNNEDDRSLYNQFQLATTYNDLAQKKILTDSIIKAITDLSMVQNQLNLEYNKAVKAYNNRDYQISIKIWRNLRVNEQIADSILDKIGMAHFHYEENFKDYEFTKARETLALIDTAYLNKAKGETTASLLQAYELRKIYSWTGTLTEGRRIAKHKKNEKIGYLNKDFETVIEFQFESGRSFYNGMAMVLLERKYILIDTLGNQLILFDTIFPPSDGLHRVLRDSLYGFVNLNGKVVIELQYTMASNFNQGIAIVNTNVKINKKGEENTKLNVVSEAKLVSEAEDLFNLGKLDEAKSKYEQAYAFNNSDIIRIRIDHIYALLKSVTGTQVNIPISKRPVIYKEPRYDILEKDTIHENLKLGERNWIVWADRSQIKTSTGVNLDYMQKLWVIGQNEKALRVINYDPNMYNFGLDEYRDLPVDLGWVDKNKLVLWDESLRSTDKGYRIKAMVVNTPEGLIKKRKELISKKVQKLTFYNDPYTKQSNLNDSPLFEFLFIYKEENGRVLIGKRTNLISGEAQGSMLGWIEKEVVVYWPHRLALEPSWNPNAVQEREKVFIQPAVFENIKLANEFANGEVSNSESLWTEPYLKRERASWRRFPVFSKTDNIIETGIISQIYRSDKKPPLSSEEFAYFTELYNNQRYRTKNINIVFAIDASANSISYLSEIKETILESVQDLQKQNIENTISIGVVAFRDLKKSDKCKQVERWPLSSDIQKIRSNFVELVTCEDMMLDKPKAIFIGLRESAMLFELDEKTEKETNVIFLIGSIGSKSKKYELKDVKIVKQKMVDKNISLFAIQTENDGNYLSDNLIFQIKELIEDAAIKSVKQLNEVHAGVLSFNEKISLEQREENSFWLNTQEAPIHGGLIYANKNESFNSVFISRSIRQLIYELGDKHSQLLESMDRLINSVSVNQISNALTPQMSKFLLKAGFDNEMLQILIEKRYQFMIRGYTPLKVNRLNNALYKYVLFLDQDELDDLMNDLEKLLKFNQSDYSKRKNLYETWILLLSSNYGIKKEEIHKMTVADIISLVSDLPSQTELLSQYAFTDIMDRAKMNDYDFNALINLISNKLDQLRRLNGNSEFFYLSNDQRFYWIPQEYLP